MHQITLHNVRFYGATDPMRRRRCVEKNDGHKTNYAHNKTKKAATRVTAFYESLK